MFGNLSNQLTNVAKTLSGRGAITEKNITEAMVDVRNALLEADVGFEVVKTVSYTHLTLPTTPYV